ncbi:MAG: ribonuclease HII [Candidatus Syntrophosphaera sp.]|nr:ribonuclease HII [Candidatus Syntrophosphaera sp.]
MHLSNRLIGVDEAGRGALAGPVVVAAVRLDYGVRIEGINDSKKLSPARRERMFAEIINSGAAWHIVEIDAAFIDRHNILQATLKGMYEAVSAICGPNDLCLIDGNQFPPGLACPQSCVIGGDGLHACIAAASILAKVHRDRLMAASDCHYPLYGFARHKGYGTAEHLKALAEYGPCAIHRKSFSPISDLL